LPEVLVLLETTLSLGYNGVMGVESEEGGGEEDEHSLS
jgi:hypothetical protein